jgi:hypothetical protein
MAYNFLACDRDQAFLLPPDLRDWLPAEHLAWFVLDVVDQLATVTSLRPTARGSRLVASAPSAGHHGRSRTCAGSRRVTLSTPSNCRVRMISLARMSTARWTPRSPPAISP